MPAVSGKAARNRSQGGDGSLDESRDDAGKTSTSQNRSREEIEEEEEDECPPSPVEESSEGTGDGAMQTRIDILPSRLTVGASTSSAPRNDIRKKSNPHAQRRSFYEEDVNYALVFVPEFCHAPDMLCSAVRTDVVCVLYDAETPLSDLIKVARSRIEDVHRKHYASDGDTQHASGDGKQAPPAKLDCVGFVCVDDDTMSTDVSRAIMGTVNKDLELSQFWNDMGEMLRSGIGRQLHIFVNMCENPDATTKIAFTDIEKKQRLSRAHLRDCDMDTMVTSQNSGVTAVYHSTAGMYFYEEGLVEWVSSLRSTRTAIQIERASMARRNNSTKWISSNHLRSIFSGSSLFRVGSLLRSVIPYTKSTRRGSGDASANAVKEGEGAFQDDNDIKAKDHPPNDDVIGIPVPATTKIDKVLTDASSGCVDVGD